MSTALSRDPSDYSPTIHAGQQAKHRGVDFADVAQTIREGEVRNTHKRNCRLFVNDLPWCDDPVGVVADVVTGEIVTVEFRR